MNIRDEMRQRFEEVMMIRKHRRKQEEIISDLTEVIKDLNKKSFLPYIMQMLNSIEFRNTLEAFKHLMSPMKQLAYLIDLYFSVETGGIKEGMTEDEWQSLTKLLHEIEMTYFGDIGFFNEDTEEGLNIEKVSVSLKAFLDYFGNVQLSYEEQTLQRLERNCGAFSSDVERLLGFSVNDAIIFSAYIKDLINRKLNDCNYYFLHQDKWQQLTAQFIKRGITNPKEWIDEPELSMFKCYTNIPGFIFMHSKNDIDKINLPDKTRENILRFLSYNQLSNKGKTIYYASRNEYFDTPLIKLDESIYLCPFHKFLIECFYNRINEILAYDLGEKYIQYKNQMLENKVVEVFRKLFGKEGQIFTSYYFDQTRSEQDILIYYNKNYFIIEVKDCLFRAPMRDPIKAYNKIKSDFKRSIQYGYNQCKRVEDEFAKGIPFKIYDHKTKKVLHEIIPEKTNNYFSIIVTQFKYGGIQTNLEELLQKEEEDLYPWAVCVDDLEVFILALKKLKSKKATNQFVEYLNYREYYHERLICSDELEMCGFFINSPFDFKKYAQRKDEWFNTFMGMSDLFDAEYKNGLGFDNEIDKDIKKYYRVPSYKKSYQMDTFRGLDLLK